MGKRLEEGGGSCKTSAKKCPVDTFLARGRVHQCQTASGTDVGWYRSFASATISQASLSHGSKASFWLKWHSEVFVSNGKQTETVSYVWAARTKSGQYRRRYVVGWYEHAKVCRTYDTLDIQYHDGSEKERWYNVSCRFEDATLLPAEIRKQPQWAIPRNNRKNPVEYGFGQANIWYASEPAAAEFVKRMIHQIETYSGENAKVEV